MSQAASGKGPIECVRRPSPARIRARQVARGVWRGARSRKQGRKKNRERRASRDSRTVLAPAYMWARMGRITAHICTGIELTPAHIRDGPGPSPRARQKSARRSAVGPTASRPLRCSESLAGPSVAKETRQFRHLAPTTKAAGTGKLKARRGCCQRESKSQSVWGVSRAQGRYASGMADGERASGIGVLVH